MKDVNCMIECKLSKCLAIKTDKYTIEEWDDWIEDSKEGIIHVGNTKPVFDNNDLLEKYKDNYFDIYAIISHCKLMAEREIKNPDLSKDDYKFLYKLIESCKRWTLDETSLKQIG